MFVLKRTVGILAVCAGLAIVGVEAVRRQIIWNRWEPDLREASDHLVGDIMPRASGAASGDVGWFVV